jgi:transposase InsO family protein
MSTREQLIKARLGMLALADELKNIARACKLAGVSRSHFYEIKRAYETFGKEGLAPKLRRRPRMPNQTPPEVEQQILAMTEQYPTHSYARLADQLKLVGVGVSAAAVRAVWTRHGLATRFARLLWLERKSAEGGVVLTERLKRLLQRGQARSQDPEAHVESPRPGYLLCQDTYYVGTIKRVGRIYMQSVVDAFCSLGFGKLYLSKLPMTAVDILHERVLPFYDERGVAIEHLLTDNGREFCGRPLHHPYELFLAVSQIEHRNTRVHAPYTNGFCERFHRTASDEFFKVAFRQKLYLSVAELQADLDAWLEQYNTARPHHGYRTQGRTPLQAFTDGLTVSREEVPPAA